MYGQCTNRTSMAGARVSAREEQQAPGKQTAAPGASCAQPRRRRQDWTARVTWSQWAPARTQRAKRPGQLEEASPCRVR